MNNDDRRDWMLAMIIVMLFFICILLASGCTSARASLPVQQAVAMEIVEDQEQLVAKVTILELLPDAMVQKRLAVYDADMWDYPYKDWTSVQIPDGEAWEGWYATTSTGMAVVEWEYSLPLIYGGLEQSANMQDWYRTFTIDHYYIRHDQEKNTWSRKASVPLVADPVTGSVKKQFFRLEFPWVNSLEAVMQ